MNVVYEDAGPVGRFRAVIRWLDRNIWIVAPTIFVCCETSLVTWTLLARHAVLISVLSSEVRQQIYSSLISSASSLLGFTLAAIAILAALGPRELKRFNEADPGVSQAEMGRAYNRVVACFVSASAFLLALLVLSIIAQGIDRNSEGNWFIGSVIISASLSALLGLLLGSAALALTIIERGRRAVR